ncbi:MAG: hypothetical protein ACK6D3_12590 [Planctomycetaceae bacterium]|jgi:hypothetical protein
MNPLQMAWWRQAFALPVPAPWESGSATVQRLDWLARQVVDRGLAVPAVMLLESVRPLQGGASRLLPFFEPLWTPFAVDAAETGRSDWVRLLEHPAAVDWLIRRIEELGTPPATTPAAADSNQRTLAPPS